MTDKEIIAKLPYQAPFLFVDAIEALSENGLTGSYTFKSDEYFYKGHFKNHPVTPGVILTECMAQIGLVSLGIYLLRNEHVLNSNIQVALTSHQIDFYLPVFPNEKVTVISEKEYFRFNKLKCKVKMFNRNDELVCRGVISGMLKVLQDEE
ncbi:hydroxymyristoyl-ACP dehydratase [Paucihalobacter ruber]|uniref:Hydroxymyristoyl-ACP dehydratase n=1 Tax=Paucihalobacter ruber TaxID=2567861 RepID=A0A506PMR5_9FLAO|nr:hydroxymyristoyl-ACP dehydratase [Paucihalobacter ruber]TPV34859.1 hydroxymyristoyl-ACP dehydratase [Paucihalobacter ruber]